MPNLFTWFQNYLNPSKLTAVTVPGMIVAFALVLVLGPIPCRKPEGCPLCAATLKPADADKGAQTKDQSSGTLSANDGYVQVTLATWQTNASANKELTSVDTDAAALKLSVKPVTDACQGLPNEVYANTGQIFNGEPKTPSLAEANQAAKDDSKHYTSIQDLNKQIHSCSDALKPVSAAINARTSQGGKGRTKGESGATETELTSALNDLNERLSAVKGATEAADPTTGNATWVHLLKGSWGTAQLVTPVDVQIPNDAGLISGAEGKFLPHIGDACDSVPRGVVPNSLIALSDSGSGKDVIDEQNKAKKAAQSLQRVGSLLHELNACNNQLQVVTAALATAQSSITAQATQQAADLTSLSSAKVTAQQAAENLVVADLQAKIDAKTADLKRTQQLQAQLQNASKAVNGLSSQITAMLGMVNVPVAGPPDKSNTATDVFDTIQQNLLKFLLFSLILGQILDPIQRGAVSFFGPRRDFFTAFNQVYGQSGDGEFRYGDRRLIPWVAADGTITEVPSGSSVNLASHPLIAELRPNPAGRSFLNDRNIYDKNYAIGAGLITQTEAKSIEDEYFGQSQITSGLIIPTLVLSICIGIRIICCSTDAVTNWFWYSLMGLVILPFGIIFGALASLAALWISSRKYALLLKDALSSFFHWDPEDEETRRAKQAWMRAEVEVKPEIRNTAKNWHGYYKHKLHIRRRSRNRQWILFSLCLVLLLLGIIDLSLALWATSGSGTGKGLNLFSLFMILLPTLGIGPLWIAGLDRLHKYYSELQARIAGNVLRLQSSTEQKFIDLISDPVAACALKDKIKTMSKARESLAECLKGIPCKDDVKSAADQQAETLPQIEGSDQQGPSPQNGAQDGPPSQNQGQ